MSNTRLKDMLFSNNISQNSIDLVSLTYLQKCCNFASCAPMAVAFLRGGPAKKLTISLPIKLSIRGMK